ncbi:hypothetical protein GCM10010521_18800 [Streptomyces rameus]|uniref:Uncharacterized protein n=1 Tax=Streptomyces rameus TaxID=68261 RepID=A0ABP6N3H1_9ACTN
MGTRSTTQARAPRLVTSTRSTVGSPAAALARTESDRSAQRTDRSWPVAAWLCAAVSSRAAAAAEAAGTAMAARMRMRISPCRGRTGYVGRQAPAQCDDRYAREVAPVHGCYPDAPLPSPAAGRRTLQSVPPGAAPSGAASAGQELPLAGSVP